jgi:hypothetical protein
VKTIYHDKPRLPFGQALRKYWPFLLGLVAFHFLVIFVPAVAEQKAVLIVLFFGVTYVAMWPYLHRDAPYSFWIFACVYWVGGAVLVLLLKIALTGSW